ncbi:MAG: hypothetical protein ACYC3I_04485, partial [Gemmataceae bacterium]
MLDGFERLAITAAGLLVVAFGFGVRGPQVRSVSESAGQDGSTLTFDSYATNLNVPGGYNDNAPSVLRTSGQNLLSPARSASKGKSYPCFRCGGAGVCPRVL